MRILVRTFAVLVAGFTVVHAAGSITIAKPSEAGFSAERLLRIEPLIKSHIEARDLPGAVTLVARRGKVVQFSAFGTTDFESNTPMRTDTLFRLASMTKPVTAVAILMLLEEGKLILSDPVSKFIPEFKNPRVAVWNAPNDPRGGGARLVPADHEITLQHLLTHTSGLADGGNDGPAAAAFREAGMTGLSLAEYSKKAGGLPLRFQPGTQWEYSPGVGFSVLGRVVEIVSGMTLDQFMQRRIFTPLGMNSTFFTVPADRSTNIAAVYTMTPKGLVKQQARPPAEGAARVEFFSGAGGLTGTTEDYFRFAQMLLNGGQFDGVRLLSRKSVELMSDNAVGDLDLRNYAVEGQELRGYGFGLGVRVRKSTGTSGWLGSVGDYGWAGANGTYFWIDPKEQMIGMVMMAVRIGRLRTEFPNVVYQAIID